MNGIHGAIIGYWIIAACLQWSAWLLASHFQQKMERKLRTTSSRHPIEVSEQPLSNQLLPIDMTIVVPVYNERRTILATIGAVLQIPAQQLEVIVIDDGSTDGTDRLVKDFFSERCQLIRQANLGKATALNQGLALAQHPWIMVVDADTQIDPEGIRKLLTYIIDSPDKRFGAVGGAIMIDSCHSILARMQAIEYQRAFGIGLPASSVLKSTLLVPGACSLFSTAALRQAGGFYNDSLAEDLDIVMRIHQQNRWRKKPYTIEMLPLTIATTEAVESWRSLRAQRIRWHRGLLQTLIRYRSLLFQRPLDRIGGLALPFLFLFGWAQPLVMFATFFVIALQMQGEAISTFRIIWIGLNWWMINAVFGLVSHLKSAHLRQSMEPIHWGSIFFLLIIEPLLYRPLLAYWRLQANWHDLSDRPKKWSSDLKLTVQKWME